MEPDDERHGTYGGCLAHRREGTKPCDPCRLAFNTYMREFRSIPKNNTNQKKGNRARSKALWRLAKQYPDEYQKLYTEELINETLQLKNSFNP